MCVRRFLSYSIIPSLRSPSLVLSDSLRISPDCFSLAALQRDGERVPHAGGAAVRRTARRAGDLLDALRDQLRDALQDLRDRAGRARLHHGAHEEVQQHHA